MLIFKYYIKWKLHFLLSVQFINTGRRWLFFFFFSFFLKKIMYIYIYRLRLIIHGTLSRVREYLYFATFDSYLSISFFSFCIKENFRTHIHTHRCTRVRTPLSSYLILATSTEAKCTLIGNYWTSVFFFEREKKFSRWHLFFYTFFPLLSLSLSRSLFRNFSPLVSLVDQSSLLWNLSSGGRRKQARKGSIVRPGESTLRSARGHRNDGGTTGYSPRDRVNPITRKAAAAAAL